MKDSQAVWADYVVSGWSFFFRWPVANAGTFRSAGVFLGPFLQLLVFLFFSLPLCFLLPSESLHWSVFSGWVGLSMMTGFFHEDGLADTADSLGVSKFDSAHSLERIQSTFKDPRLGTFGVSALVLFWLFRYGSAAHGQMGLGAAALACLFSRAISLGLGLYFFQRLKHANTPRSSHVMQDVNVRDAGFCLGLAVIAGTMVCVLTSGGLTAPFFPDGVNQDFMFVVLKLVGGVALAALVSGFLLKRLISRTEALNGDMLGATVCVSEILITFCYLNIL